MIGQFELSAPFLGGTQQWAVRPADFNGAQSRNSNLYISDIVSNSYFRLTSRSTDE
jgi:hypothetical protein